MFPPYIKGVKDRKIIANSIEIIGLHGRPTEYSEDFSGYTNQTKSNTPAAFIVSMIQEAATNIKLSPVIDDRMFVQCWYKNDEWTEKYKREKYHQFLSERDWYAFVHIDEINQLTCHNDNMIRRLIKESTYNRWQEAGSLYGITKYSFMLLTDNKDDNRASLTNYFEPIYARMSELILVQKASVLRFSSEVTNISNMEEKKGFSEKVSSLYKEYIRFVNQIHFREISAQDQGIDMYKMLYDAMNLEKQVDKLDEEIEELYNYVSLREDHKQNSTISLLTWIATIAVPMTMVAGFFGMNNVGLDVDEEKEPILWYNTFSNQVLAAIIVTFIIIIIILTIKNRKPK